MRTPLLEKLGALGLLRPPPSMISLDDEDNR